MRLKALEPLRLRTKLAHMAASVFYFAGIAAIVGWSLPKESPAVHRTELAMRVPDTGVPGTTVGRSAPVPATGGPRNKANCGDCGVIESVRRIDTREEMMGWCTVGDVAGTRVPGNPIDSGERLDLVTVADTVAGVTSGARGAKKVKLTTRHQIVVRFRDGSRRIFNEETPRSLRVGDRIQVIAGAAGPNG